VIACRARRVTDGMLLAAARAVAGRVSRGDLADGCVYPEVAALYDVSGAVAEAVAPFEVGL
jgi:malic enzyme